jgi:hypothetical protein
MAITKSQQARQMLKKGTKPVEQAGVMNYMPSEMVTVPKVAKSSPTHPTAKLAYITDAEKKLLIKKNLHGSLKGKPNKGPGGIPSLQGDFGGPGGFGGFQGGGDYSSAETGNLSGFSGTGSGPELPPGVTPKGSPEAQAIRSSFIAAGGGQRVNPGFFDSRNTVSPAELAAAKAFAPSAFAKSRRGSFLDFISGGGITGALIRGLGQRFGFGKKFNQPTYDMSRFSGLPLGGSASFQNLDIRDKFDRRNTDDDEDDTLNIDEFGYSPSFLSGLVDEVALTGTPEQKELMKEKMEDSNEQDFSNFDDAIFASGLTTPSEGKFGLNLVNYSRLKNNRYSDKQIQEAIKGGYVNDLLGTLALADGGMIGGGIMDAAGRQGYFFGKLVKKAKRAVKKIVKSPIGKLGLGALIASAPFGGPLKAFSKFRNLSGPMQALIGGGALSAVPLIVGKEEEEQPSGFTGSVGGQIDPRAYTDPYGVLFSAFKAEGGSMKDEPVAKRTMPLLDMGGQEMDLRAEGGFVPIGRMEKADDVPARLSKNEFVFTADAVRNAGDGDVDKGAEVMYNMMKNLEAGGEVSEESQGLEGARNMFQTSKRLEEVI